MWCDEMRLKVAKSFPLKCTLAHSDSPPMELLPLSRFLQGHLKANQRPALMHVHSLVSAHFGLNVSTHFATLCIIVVQLHMESLEHSDEKDQSFPWHKFCEFREQDKLIDLRITTEEGKCVKAHRLILAAKFPLFLRTTLCGQNGMAFCIVEAIVNYAYTGELTISTENATQLCLLAHKLGCRTIVSWCVEFLKRFKGLCLPGEILMQTKFEQFEMLLEDIQLKGASEEAKFLAISKWLETSLDERDLEERGKVFAKLFSKVDLTKLSPQCLTEFWTFVRGYSKLFQAGKHSVCVRNEQVQ
ncbi:Kelch-like protein 18 [Taenia solium]|eukprot:TsM_000287700 transcript=TsM_000287700 gene=TsM_000287700